MTKNYGKDFEYLIRKTFESIPEVSIDRIPDQTMGFKDRKNVSDFIVYKYPNLFYIECKAVHGNTLPFTKITQLDGLIMKSRIRGVRAGVMCWWVDKDVTRWLPAESLEIHRLDHKSIRFDADVPESMNINGRKKKVFFDYDLIEFLERG